MNKCLICNAKIPVRYDVYHFLKANKPLCHTCQQQWLEIQINNNTKRCSKCLKIMDDEEKECLDCTFLSRHGKLMEQLYCNFEYKGIMKEVMHQIKFLRDQYLCQLLAELIQFPDTSYDLIVPIPSSYERDRQRTFNPVIEVLKAKELKYHNILCAKYRPKQFNLTKNQRMTMENPFSIIENIDLTDKEILLIDDIYTTGLTIHHAGCKLYDKNIRKFKVFAFAR